MFPDFCENHQFHVMRMLFQRISYSSQFMFMIFKEQSTKSFGLVPFSAKYLVCRHVRMDGLMDRLTN
jgi:hypothetical protein